MLMITKIHNPEYLAIPIFIVMMIVGIVCYFGKKISKWTEDARQMKEMLDKESHKKGNRYEQYRKRFKSKI